MNILFVSKKILTIFNLDMILEYCIPLFQNYFVIPGTGLCSDQLFEIANGIIGIALDPDLFPQSVIACDFNHDVNELD